MARVFIIGCVFLMPLLLGAQEEASTGEGNPALSAKNKSGKRVKPTKRKGSFLIRNKAPEHAPDLRGDLGRRRDYEIRLHFGRLAELDVLERLGRKHKEVEMSKRVEQLRRKEMARYRTAMVMLRRAARYTQGVGIP